MHTCHPKKKMILGGIYNNANLKMVPEVENEVLHKGCSCRESQIWKTCRNYRINILRETLDFPPETEISPNSDSGSYHKNRKRNKCEKPESRAKRSEERTSLILVSGHCKTIASTTILERHDTWIHLWARMCTHREREGKYNVC